MITRKKLCLIAGAGSLALLLGAFGFQYLADMAPCKLCLWQRWPHGVAILVSGLAVLWRAHRLLPWSGALAALTSAGIGAYHTGVERGWWEGPSTCTSGPITGLSSDELMAQIMAAPLVRCDEVPWELFTLSMASWNVLMSLVLVVIWVLAARQKT